VSQERLYRTEGIVLREMDYAEADRILTLLTPGGKLAVLARGIRRATSRKVGHLGLFYRAQLMIARGRNLDIITQAESLEEFEGIRGDLLRFTYACYVAELVDRFAQEEEESVELYELLTHRLRWLAVEDDPRLWTRYFELRLLAYTGYQPQLFSCVACHRRIDAVTNYFVPGQGGMLCPECARDEPTARAVSVSAQKVLRYLQTHDAATVRTLRITEVTHAEMETLLQAYLEYVLERELKSPVFLRRLRSELRAVRPMVQPPAAHKDEQEGP
jgi:DNA repair protein RecO (recombination protein O)